MRRDRCCRLAALVLALALLSGCAGTDGAGEARAAAFQESAAALRAAAVTDQVRQELGEDPAGEAGWAVFFSVCGGAERASVYSAAGDSLESAWDAAASAAETALARRGPDPVWVKADIVYLSQVIGGDWLDGIGEVFAPGCFRFGLAFDPGYETALLEAELNSAGIYDYENGGVDLTRLNEYLESQGRKTVEALPEEYTAFQTAGWLCDGSGTVYPLMVDDTGYGRREFASLDGAAAAALALSGAEYLAGLTEDGGAWDALTAADRARCLSAMVQCYALSRSETLAGAIDRAAGKIAEGIAYTGEDMAYVLEGEEITLEACALTLTAMEDCEEASGSGAYLPVCEALGKGILSLLDTGTGAFTHVLSSADMTRKEAFRSPAWDGCGAAALCRLYGLTEDAMWLWAAGLVLDRMDAEDYARYGEAWTSCAAAEMTACETGRTDDYLLALKNAQQNLADIYAAQPADPAGLELLMASYRCLRQMRDAGYGSQGFETGLMLQVISAQAQKQLDNYVFPEYAMYLEDPQGALGAFLSRDQGLAVTPGGVCANIRGYLLYAVSYDALVEDGLLNEG